MSITFDLEILFLYILKTIMAIMKKLFFQKKKLDLEEGKKGVLVFKIRGIHIGANTAKTNTESIYEWKDKILMTSHSQISKVSETSS